MAQRILVVEDEHLMAQALDDRLTSRGFDVVVASTKQQAIAAFEENPDFFAVLMDGWIDGATDTCDLIRWIRTSFQGHIIAMSSNDRTRQAQRAAGCDQESWQKHRAANLVINLAQQQGAQEHAHA